MTKDILLYESGSGGEIAIENNDIALVEYVFQQIYLALFGGNVEAITKGNELTNQVRGDWWGNSVLFANDPGRQFNSLTEKALNENVLNSVGRVNIQRAAESDLQYLKSIADITVNVVILNTNKVKIAVTLLQPNNNQSASLQVIWDNAKSEMIVERTI